MRKNGKWKNGIVIHNFFIGAVFLPDMHNQYNASKLTGLYICLNFHLPCCHQLA